MEESRRGFGFRTGPNRPGPAALANQAGERLRRALSRLERTG